MSSTTELISNPSENTGPTITAIAVLFTSLATIIVATRLWVRATMVGKIGWDVSMTCQYYPHSFTEYLGLGLGHMSDSLAIHRGDGRSQ